MARTATKRGSNKGLPERSPEKDTLEHFERFAYSLRLPDDGGPFKLQTYMQDALEDYFAGVIESLWLWPTGTAKSTLLGALALHHGTYVRRNCNVLILGGLGGHGRNTLDAAAAFIDESVDLQRWWVAQEYGMGRIKSLIDRGRITVSSAGRRVGGRGGSSQEGKDPTLILVEELHRHEDNGAAVRTLTAKIQKRMKAGQPVRIVHATTAGDNMMSPLGRMVTRATDVDNGATVEADRRPGTYYRRAVDADGDLVMHELALPDEIHVPPHGATKAEVTRYLKEVKKANPANFITLRNLRITLKACSSEVWVFLRQNANQWVTQDFAAFDKVAWRAGGELHKSFLRAKKPGLTIPKAVDGVYVGLDTAMKWATTAIVPVWIDPETRRPRTSGSVFLKSDHPGTRRRMRDAIDVLQVMRERWPTMRLVFDRNAGGGLIAEQLEEDHGMVVIDHSQGTPFDLASMLLGELIDQHGIDHDENAELTAHLLAAVVRRTNHGRRWRIEQPANGLPIDGADALAMATNIALNPPEPDEEEIDITKYRIRKL
jgi:phage terminase large subunit-like protein